jgi:hypothetical protein
MKIFQPAVFVATFTVFFVLTSACQKQNDFPLKDVPFLYSIPLEGNGWIIKPGSKPPAIDEDGLKNWTDSESQVRIYFKTENVGNINIAFLAKSVSGASEMKVSLGNITKNCSIQQSESDTINVGTFHIEKAGYQMVDIQGIKKAGEFFGEIKSLLIGGEAAQGRVYYAKDDFYWARRGPSVHLNFEVPDEAGDVLYFYNEITVPEQNDVLGSYFMANGFGEGYFGMQVNSPTERRILFSVWSPYKTDNPGEIPDEYKIQLLKKGEGAYTGEFGNEGSGGQSYFVFPWKAGITYKFLLKGEPAGNGETDFTAWFFAPEVNQWKLIASWRRPNTETYLTHLYSFLENFMTETGNITRMAKYSNQWVCNTAGKWTELTKIKFTADATARKEARLDYAGGAKGSDFFLKNCGFFNETTPIGTYYTRKVTGKHPEIDFETLP